ncbi:MAG: hypothetical protein JJU02_06670 [Cryomorphaceae bacterium]|nr:hypothetical protein [Cryomorphaceae bacterium]
MKKIVLIFTAVIFAVNCGSSSSENPESAIVNQQSSLDSTMKNQIHAKGNPDEIAIDYFKNKSWLDVISLLPDSVLVSWDDYIGEVFAEWKLEDRLAWYNDIKTNNFYNQNKHNYPEIIYSDTTKACFALNEGKWAISTYQTSAQSLIVIVEDIHGEWNAINYFEFRNNKITKFSCDDLSLDNFVKNIVQKDLSVHCREALDYTWEQNYSYGNLMYEYLEDNKIEIRTNWSLVESEFSDCLNGNTILFVFNPQSKHFDIEKVYWTEYE